MKFRMDISRLEPDKPVDFYKPENNPAKKGGEELEKSLSSGGRWVTITKEGPLHGRHIFISDDGQVLKGRGIPSHVIAHLNGSGKHHLEGAKPHEDHSSLSDDELKDRIKAEKGKMLDRHEDELSEHSGRASHLKSELEHAHYKMREGAKRTARIAELKKQVEEHHAKTAEIRARHDKEYEDFKNHPLVQEQKRREEDAKPKREAPKDHHFESWLADKHGYIDGYNREKFMASKFDGEDNAKKQFSEDWQAGWKPRYEHTPTEYRAANPGLHPETERVQWMSSVKQAVMKHGKGVIPQKVYDEAPWLEPYIDNGWKNPRPQREKLAGDGMPFSKEQTERNSKFLQYASGRFHLASQDHTIKEMRKVLHKQGYDAAIKYIQTHAHVGRGLDRDGTELAELQRLAAEHKAKGEGLAPGEARPAPAPKPEKYWKGPTGDLKKHAEKMRKELKVEDHVRMSQELMDYLNKESPHTMEHAGKLQDTAIIDRIERDPDDEPGYDIYYLMIFDKDHNIIHKDMPATAKELKFHWRHGVKDHEKLEKSFREDHWRPRRGPKKVDLSLKRGNHALVVPRKVAPVPVDTTPAKSLEQGVGPHLTVYHTTPSRNVSSIKQSGLIPRHGKPTQGQNPAYNAVYFHTDEKKAHGFDVGEPKTVLKVRIPVNGDTARRIMPDEDTFHPNAASAISLGDGIAYRGQVPPEWIQ